MSRRYLQIWRDGRQRGEVLQTPLLDGEQGNAQTLAAMIGIVRADRLKADLRRLVLDLVIKDTAGHNFAGEIKQIFEFAQSRITYRKDAVGVERVVDLWTCLFGLENSRDYSPEGDCGIKSVFIATCCALLGHRPFFVIIKQDEKSQSFNHIYNAVAVGDRFYYLDATPEDKPAGYEPRALKKLVIPIF